MIKYLEHDLSIVLRKPIFSIIKLLF